MKRIIYVTFFALFCIVGLSACSTVTSTSSAKYNSNYRSYQVLNLPPDYPTKYLPDGNLWDDFRKNLQLPVNPNDKRVREQIRWIQTHQDFINRSLTRGAQYFYYIYQQTKIRHLPAELALIPVYESGYIPVGRSNKGAVGLWQFMPGTAAGYGIRMDRWFDGRRDVIISTNASLKYFSYLHYFFNDWLLAIAAYDHGEGNVQAAILRNKRKGLRTDFWSLSVPQETHVYVPQLLALAAVIKNPGKYGVNLVPINNGPYFEQVNTGKAIDINKYAKLSGIDVNLMRSLNAGYLRTTMDPDGPYTLLIPRSKVTIFKSKLKGGAAVESEPTAAAPTPTITSSSNRVVNDVDSDSSDSVDTTTTRNKRSAMTKTKLASAALQARDDEDVNDSDTVSASTVTIGTIPYKVAKGDTVYSIAKKFKANPSKIRSINKLGSNNVRVGQVIKIPHTFKTAAPSSSGKTTKPKSKPKISSSKVSVSGAAKQQKTKSSSKTVKKKSGNAKSSATAKITVGKTKLTTVKKSTSKPKSSSSANNKKNKKSSN